MLFEIGRHEPVGFYQPPVGFLLLAARVANGKEIGAARAIEKYQVGIVPHDRTQWLRELMSLAAGGFELGDLFQ
jgi:hypothetical protein